MATPGYAEARRNELDVPLTVLEGSVPPDLTGHMFFVGPVGNVGTGGFPGPRHNTVLNGDGMIYRIDFGAGHTAMGPAVPTIKTRLVRSACFYADEATDTDPRYFLHQFFNAGILRLSLTLGARDFGNTAFVPFETDGQPRLLATFDGGRPLELDTETLAVTTPVGFNDEWRAEAMGSLPFPPVLTTAHPVADARTGELFALNYGRSIGSILSRSALLMGMMTIPHVFTELLQGPLRRAGLRSRTLRASQALSRRIERAAFGVRRSTAGFRGDDIPEDFLYVARWDGRGDLQRWRVHDHATGKPVVVQQTMHQMAVTREWIVLMDTSMKITGGQAFNNPLPGMSWLERAVRAASSSPQMAHCILWLIRRADLTGDSPARARRARHVRARRVELPLEAVHFLADYDDAGDRLTLYIQHDCTLDISEWNREFDVNYFTGRTPEKEVWGVPNVTPMDLNRVGRYVIDAARGTVLERDVMADHRCTWGLAVYAGADQFTLAPQPEHVTSMFHTSPGFAPVLLTEWIHDLYADYPHRRVPLSVIDGLGEQGSPSAIFRVDPTTLAVADILTMPARSIAGALQHVPASTGPGYLVCAAIVDGRREIWVIDAGDLGRVVCKLGHPDLVYGTTIHAAWLPRIGRRSAGYMVPPRQDYGPVIARLPDLGLDELFEERVYPHWDP